MKSTHRVTVKITDRVLPKEIVKIILDRRKIMFFVTASYKSMCLYPACSVIKLC